MVSDQPGQRLGKNVFVWWSATSPVKTSLCGGQRPARTDFAFSRRENALRRRLRWSFFWTRRKNCLEKIQSQFKVATLVPSWIEALVCCLSVVPKAAGQGQRVQVSILGRTSDAALNYCILYYTGFVLFILQFSVPWCKPKTLHALQA